MDTNRRAAVMVGVLYIIGTVAGVMSVVFVGSILEDPDYLSAISINPGAITSGALCVLIMGLALAMVPVAIFPVLKKHHETLAVGYVVFRGALETVTYLVVVLSFLLLAALSQTSAVDASGLQMAGTVLIKAQEIGANLTEIIFPLGALMLYSALFRSKLIPRWLSGWGFIAVILHMISGLLHLFGMVESMSTVQTVLAFPIFVQEMVMAVWLIVKGFNPAALAAGADVN